MRGVFFFFFQAEDGIRDIGVTGVQTCALPILENAAPERTLSGAQRPETVQARSLRTAGARKARLRVMRTAPGLGTAARLQPRREAGRLRLSDRVERLLQTQGGSVEADHVYDQSR